MANYELVISDVLDTTLVADTAVEFNPVDGQNALAQAKPEGSSSSVK